MNRALGAITFTIGGVSEILGNAQMSFLGEKISGIFADIVHLHDL